MNRSSSSTSLSLALVLATALSGCGASSDRLLLVGIPDDCGRVLQQVAVPAVKTGDDLRKSLARTRGALAKANDEIDAGRTCIADVRQRGVSP